MFLSKKRLETNDQDDKHISRQITDAIYWMRRNVMVSQAYLRPLFYLQPVESARAGH